MIIIIITKHYPNRHSHALADLIHLQYLNQDVRDVLNNLNVTKACRPDLISPRLVKEGATILSKPITAHFFKVTFS